MSLRRTLFLTLIALGAASVATVGWLGDRYATTNLERALTAQLVFARESRARELENRFRQLRSEMKVLGTTWAAVRASREFTTAVDALAPTPAATALQREALAALHREQDQPVLQRVLRRKVGLEELMPTDPKGVLLQHQLLVANPHPYGRRALFDQPVGLGAYDAAHAMYHPAFRYIATSMGFVDLFLVDPASGRIVYSMLKESDIGMSVFSGPLADSGLALAVLACSQKRGPGEVCLQDFSPYLPSRGAPAAFAATPVFDQGRMVGILAAQLSTRFVDAIMTADGQWERQGFGVSGEAYVVGPDRTLRSTVRTFIEDRDSYFASLAAAGVTAERIEAIREFGTPVLQQRVATEAVTAAFAGAEGTRIITGYLGQRSISTFKPLRIEGLEWVVVAKIDVAEAFEPITSLRRYLIVVGLLVMVAVVIAAAWLSRSLLVPLQALTDAATRFSEGETDVQVPVLSQDEVGRLCETFNRMVRRISEEAAVIELKSRENEALLLNILPAPIAGRLRGGNERIADKFADVSVLFADIVGFTQLSASMSAHEVVALLDELFTRFDLAAQELGIEKIKTIGDSYMAVCGLPEQRADHADRMIQMAIRMLHIVREFGLQHGHRLQLRVGINTGPVVAGVIGRHKFIYDLWGDTVNLASRMESHGIADAIQVTRSVVESLKDRFPFEPRGAVEVKGKGAIECWVLKV